MPPTPPHRRALRVVATITGPQAPRIVYPACVVKTTRQPAAAAKFLQFLRGPRRWPSSSGTVSRPDRRPLILENDGSGANYLVHAGTAVAATAVMMPPGLLLAWVLARLAFRGRVLLDTLVSLPLVMPPVATGLILLMLFAPRGPIGGALGAAGHRRRVHLEGGGAGDGGDGAAALRAHGTCRLRAGRSAL